MTFWDWGATITMDEEIDRVHGPTQKSTPQGGSAPWGVILCLTAFAVPVKPLADVVTDHTRSDRHEEIDRDFHRTHLLSVARVKKGSVEMIPKFDRKVNRELRRAAKGPKSNREGFSPSPVSVILPIP